MSTTFTLSQQAVYRIRVAGTLDADWSGWLDDCSVSTDEQRVTTLVVFTRDQAELHGVLRRLYYLGLPLLSVCQRVPDGDGDKLG